jgi:hypothetical protein
LTPSNPTIVLSPARLSFSAIGGSAAARVRVAQGAYNGTFRETNDCSKVATFRVLANGSGEATYAVTPLGAGSCKATFTGGAGATASLPVSVKLVGDVVLRPASVSFSATGSSDAKTVAVSQSGYDGAFRESDDCAKVATLSVTADGRGEASYTVTPVGAGSCKATFAGGGDATAVLPISVVPLGTVVLKPGSVSFTATGTSNARAVTVTQAGFDGAFRESDDCSGIATVEAVDDAGGNARYTVTPVGGGSCAVRFAGGGRQSASLPVSVTIAGGVVLDPSRFHFGAAGPAYDESLSVTQTNYEGTFDESDDCSKIASIAASSDTGGKASYTVEPIGPGSCSAAFAGGSGKSSTLPVSVDLPQPLVAVVCAKATDKCSGGSSGVVKFTAIGDTATLTPSDPKWSNAPDFTLQSDTCNKSDDPNAGGNWATLAPSLGSAAAAFVVTAKNGGSNANLATCVATLVDAAGRTVTIDISVTLGSVGIH